MESAAAPPLCACEKYCGQRAPSKTSTARACQPYFLNQLNCLANFLRTLVIQFVLLNEYLGYHVPPKLGQDGFGGAKFGIQIVGINGRAVRLGAAGLVRRQGFGGQDLALAASAVNVFNDIKLGAQIAAQ